MSSGEESYAATMIGSAISGMLARIPCHPLDTVKARLQVQTMPGGSGASAPYRNAVDAIRRIFAEEGFRGLYRGFGITFVGSAPGTMLYFTSYEAFKNLATSKVSLFAAVPTLGHFVAGMGAEAVSCLLFVPIDVIKERMQVQRAAAEAAGAGTAAAPAAGAAPSAGSSSGAYYRNTADAVRKIMRNEGVRGIYRGYGATLASFGPFSALYFAIYEQLKQAAAAIAQPTPSTPPTTTTPTAGAAEPQASTAGTDQAAVLPFGWQIATASAAGASASFLTNPLDLVKLRLQVQRGDAAHAAIAGASAPAATAAPAAAPAPVGGGGGRLPFVSPYAPPQPLPFHYRNLLDGLTAVLRNEGWRAFLKGSGARMAFHAPSTAITMTLFERCRAAAASVIGAGGPEAMR